MLTALSVLAAFSILTALSVLAALPAFPTLAVFATFFGFSRHTMLTATLCRSMLTSLLGVASSACSLSIGL
jgi:hypothetical protein